MTRRIVVTGVGLVTPFGCDVAGFWDAMRRGQSAVSAITDIEGTSGDVMAPRCAGLCRASTSIRSRCA